MSAPGAGGAGDKPSQCVLIIDDDKGYVGVLAEFLNYEGLCTILASSGEAGLAAARRDQPDVILLDVQMPGIDGTRPAAGSRRTPPPPTSRCCS